MVERFERNKLYVNSNIADKIVKCIFVSEMGSALLTFVCKHPDWDTTRALEPRRYEILSSSPENWDEFTLPEVPGLTKWAVSFLGAVGRNRVMGQDIYDTEEAALAHTQRTSISEAKRESLSYMLHPIVITQRQTLEQFVRSVEEQGDFV